MEADVKALCAASLAIAGACLVSPAPAAAQDWPNRPVRIVNTFAAGGAADFLARTVADNLTVSLNQQFFVETRPGASGAIGVQSVMNTPPDGYNFVITTVTMLVLLPMTNPKLGYDPKRDLTNVAYLGGSPIVVSVNAKGAIRTLADFIAHGRSSAKPMTFSSSGVGSSGHLFGELLGPTLGIKVEHVPYKGAAQGLTDLVGGHIAFSVQTVTSTAALMRGGTLHGVAVASKERMADFPAVPTFRELGHPDLVSVVWFALSGPKGLPDAIVQKLNREIGKIMTAPGLQDRMRNDGMVTEALSPAQLAALIDQETRYWRPVIEKAGLASH
jgi:tripartite-type tricarboxylate transporter receptor subunit TctC